jgi:hypothetical protein
MQVTYRIVGFPINYSVSECYHSALPWQFPHDIINTRALNAFSHYHKCSLDIVPGCSNRSSVITFDYVHYHSPVMVPCTLPVTTASGILVTLHETYVTRYLYIRPSSSSFAFKARRDEVILKLCCSEYFPRPLHY